MNEISDDDTFEIDWIEWNLFYEGDFVTHLERRYPQRAKGGSKVATTTMFVFVALLQRQMKVPLDPSGKLDREGAHELLTNELRATGLKYESALLMHNVAHFRSTQALYVGQLWRGVLELPAVVTAELVEANLRCAGAEHPAAEVIKSKDHGMAHMLGLLFPPADDLLSDLFVSKIEDA